MLYVVVAVPHLICALGLWRLRRHGRWLQLALAWASLAVVVTFYDGLYGLESGCGFAAHVLCLVALYRLAGRRSFAASDRTEAPALSTWSPLPIALAALWCLHTIGFGMSSWEHSHEAAECGKLRQTMNRERVFCRALDEYWLDNESYPEVASIGELAEALAAYGGQQMVQVDGWGRPFRYQTWPGPEGAEDPDPFLIASAGRDGKWELDDPRDYPSWGTFFFSFDGDTVMLGSYVLYIRYMPFYH